MVKSKMCQYQSSQLGSPVSVQYKERFQAAADEAFKDPKVIGFYSTQQCLHVPLTDPEKTARIPHKVVNLFCFESFEQFEAFWPSVESLVAAGPVSYGPVAAGPCGCIWGDKSAQKVKVAIGDCVGDMISYNSWLGLNEMVVCPPYGEGSTGHSDHTFNCEITAPVSKEDAEKGIVDKSCAVM